MGGALLQLHAQGAQDVFLTGNPQMTYFKSVYRRHTNFAMETRKLNKQKRGNKEIVRLDKLGDLVYKMYIEIIIPKYKNTEKYYYFNPGTSFLKKIELKIGEQLIDTHSKKWLETYYSLTEKNNQGLFGYHINETYYGLENDIVKYTTKFQELSGSGNYLTNIFTNGKKFMIPLTFWFCKNSGCALPIGALRNHEAKLEIETSDDYNNYPDDTDFHVYADYIYLDKDESRRFKQVSHDYLIEQVQEVVKDVVQSSFKDYSINFYHPVKEIIWTCTQDIENFISTKPNLDQSEGQVEDLVEEPGDKFKFDGKLTIKINGVEIISEMDSTYYTRKQIYDNHTGPGGLHAIIDKTTNIDISCFNDSICVYSFALHPEDYQPSGTCNFSRANQLNIEYRDLSDLSITPLGVIDKRTNPELTFFAVNYNLLRIQDGLCGLVYR